MKQTFLHSLNNFSRISRWRIAVLAAAFVLISCGGGGGGDAPSSSVSSSSSSSTSTSSSSSSSTSSVVGDDARRAVLKDIGEQIILPALRDFDTKATALKVAADALALAPSDATLLANAKAAWNAAMTSWQRSEMLQVGPAGRSTNPDLVAGGQDFRDLIYSWPLILNACNLEAAAATGAAVDGSSAANIIGLGALEQLLFTSAPPSTCASQPTTAQRAAHIQKLAARVAILATSIRNRWEPTVGNFIAQWNTAGAGSAVYARPQDALNALSVALFYGEKIAKDRKVAYATGLPATGLTCGNPTSCPEFLESRTSRHSGANLLINMQTFKDVFTGVNGKLGMNDLLTGIGRSDLAQDFITKLNAVIAQLNTIQNGQGFDAAVEGITDRTACINAFTNSSGLPPCALNGFMKSAMDTFRGPIVAALSLAIPDSAAGDND